MGIKSNRTHVRYGRFTSLIFIALLGLSACGGGGGSSDGDKTPNVGGSSDASSTTLISPAGVTLTKDFNAKTINISWTAVPNAKSYTVYSAEQSASALAEAGFTNYSSLTGHKIQTNITATKHTLSGLTQGKTYYVLVQAVNDSKQSAYKAGDEKSVKLSRFEKLAGYEGKCVIDHNNNLVWEVKQDSGLHGKAHTYSWYQTSNNGNNVGSRNRGTCYNKSNNTTSGNQCDTTGFVNAVNTEKWCGFADWRMPTKDELKSLVDEVRKTAQTPPTIDTTFFPNTSSVDYWSSSPNANLNVGAWGVDFNSGYDGSILKANSRRARLVRSQSPAPKQLSMKQDGATKLTFTWKSVDKASNYMLYTSKGDLTGKTLGQIKALESSTDANTKVTKTMVSSSNLTHTLEGLSLGDKRYAVVTAMVNSIESVPSATVNKTVARFQKMTGANAGKCVIDHEKNLIWEVKQDSGLHGKNNTYSWYLPDPDLAGGVGLGTQNMGTCSGSFCDTTSFVKEVNEVGLCGYKNWRMPSKDELSDLFAIQKKASNKALFPNTVSKPYWTPDLTTNNEVFTIDFSDGFELSDIMSSSNLVRLIHDL